MTTPIDPDFREGFTAHQRGDLTVAADCYRRVLARDPRHFDCLHLLGVIHLQTGDAAAAVQSIGAALSVDVNQPVALNNQAAALQALRQFDYAAAHLDQAIALKPDYAEAYYNRANVRRDQRRYDEALADYDRALGLNPRYAEAYLNRGIEYARRDQPARAVTDYDRALAVNPTMGEVYYNKGNALRAQLLLAEAADVLSRAVALKPDFAEAFTSRAMTYLLMGNFSGGWRDYEWRWRTPEFGVPRTFSAPPWRGDSNIKGKTILLYAEQGLGDTIQFCRYVPRVAALGARVMLEVHAPLKGLLATLDGVAQVVAKGEQLPPYDAHCPLMSLPFAFKTDLNNIPAVTPYLRIDADKATVWGARLGEKTRPRIGLSWSGSGGYGLDRHRSMPLELLMPLLALDMDFIALQKDLRDEDRAVLDAHPNLRFFGDALIDFTDTAALAAHVDLVISVDTVGAHLAGALGKPAWILLPFIPDWRWMTGRDDTPWYPLAKLFRQTTSGDWPELIDRVTAQLRTATI